MILDRIENSKLYSSISRKLSLGFEFIQNTDLELLTPGRYDIAGDEVFALVSEYQSKNPEDCRMEAHQVYTDIQYLISGSELIGHELRNNQPVINEYNPDKDIAFFEGNGMPLLLKPGLFAVFFPHDLHRPCMKIEQSEPIKKVVIKLKL